MIMQMESLGELAPDPDIEEWRISEPVSVGCFPDTPLRFVLEDVADDPAPAEFEAAVRNFLALTIQDRDEATPYVFKNYTDFAEAVGDDDLDFSIDTPADVWAHVQPSEIHVLRRAYGDRKFMSQSLQVVTGKRSTAYRSSIAKASSSAG